MKRPILFLPAAALVLLLAIAPILPVAAQVSDGVPVTAEFQAWADGNNDRVLQPRECEELMGAVLRFFIEAHPATNPFDTFLDANRDGRISPDEIDRGWVEIVLPRLQRLLPANPEAARLVDVNDDGRIDEDEALMVVEYLRNPASLQPHRAASPIDGRIDANRDGRVGADEIAGFRERLVRAVVLLPPEVELPGGQWVIERRYLDVLADVNGSGELEPEEERWREAALAGPHTAKTAIDKLLDADHDGKVEQSEIDGALNTQRNQDERMSAERAAEGKPIEQPVEAPRSAGTTSETTTPAAPAAASAPPSASTTATAAASTATSGTAATTAATPAAPVAASTGVTLEEVSIEEIFPVFRSYYDDHPIGTASLKNGTAAAIENVRVELVLETYMETRKPCTAPTTIASGASGKVELLAVFNTKVLDITEGTKALAKVTVSYTVGGKSESKDFVQTVQFLGLNALTWDDDQRAAAFVTTKDPFVQQFRSAVVTSVDKAVTAVDLKLRTAMALHQTLVKYGLKYWTDPNTAYETVTKTKGAVDYLQFPAQTIQLKTGDCDDLSILVSALLESASVESAFVTVPGHIFVAFALSMKQDEAKKTFAKPDDLIYKYDKVWVPWEITALSGGFLKAWETGAREWRASDAKGEAGFHPVQEAWKKYKPVSYAESLSATLASRITVTLPSEADWTKAYTEEVKTFINQQIATQVQKLQADIKANPTKPEHVNKLGVLYARYGLTAEAEKELLKLDKQDYVPALINLGNLAFLKPDMKTALAYYGRACKKEATNARALLGSARANHELENYGSAQEAYAALKKVDPTLASQYAYLELQGTEADQAAKAGKVTDKVEWEVK